MLMKLTKGELSSRSRTNLENLFNSTRVCQLATDVETGNEMQEHHVCFGIDHRQVRKLLKWIGTASILVWIG